MKGSDGFKDVISGYLKNLAENDPLVAASLAKPGKNIDDCCTYILNTVQKSGRSGFSDAEVFGMALHYYDEAEIEIGKPVTGGRVVVNHTIELTEEEKEKAKQEAYRKVVDEEKRRMRSAKSTTKDIPLSADEEEAARQAAFEKVVEDQKNRLKKKAATAPKKEIVSTQQSLF